MDTSIPFSPPDVEGFVARLEGEQLREELIRRGIVEDGTTNGTSPFQRQDNRTRKNLLRICLNQELEKVKRNRHAMWTKCSGLHLHEPFRIDPPYSFFVHKKSLFLLYSPQIPQPRTEPRSIIIWKYEFKEYEWKQVIVPPIPSVSQTPMDISPLLSPSIKFQHYWIFAPDPTQILLLLLNLETFEWGQMRPQSNWINPRIHLLFPYNEKTIGIVIQEQGTPQDWTILKTILDDPQVSLVAKTKKLPLSQDRQYYFFGNGHFVKKTTNLKEVTLELELSNAKPPIINVGCDLFRPFYSMQAYPNRSNTILMPLIQKDLVELVLIHPSRVVFELACRRDKDLTLKPGELLFTYGKKPSVANLKRNTWKFCRSDEDERLFFFCCLDKDSKPTVHAILLDFHAERQEEPFRPYPKAWLQSLRETFPCDVRFMVKDPDSPHTAPSSASRPMEAHRLILSTRSEYFKRLLEFSAPKGELTTIEIVEHHQAFAWVLDFLYDDLNLDRAKSDKGLPHDFLEHLEELFILSGKYLMQDLQTLVIEVFLNHLDHDDFAIKAFLLITDHALPTLDRRFALHILDYIQKNREKLFANEAFMSSFLAEGVDLSKILFRFPSNQFFPAKEYSLDPQHGEFLFIYDKK